MPTRLNPHADLASVRDPSAQTLCPARFRRSSRGLNTQPWGAYLGARDAPKSAQNHLFGPLEVTETPSEGFLGARGPSRRNFGPSGPHFLCFYAFCSLFLSNVNTIFEKMLSLGPAPADFLSVPADSLPVPAVSSRSPRILLHPHHPSPMDAAVSRSVYNKTDAGQWIESGN